MGTSQSFNLLAVDILSSHDVAMYVARKCSVAYLPMPKEGRSISDIRVGIQGLGLLAQGLPKKGPEGTFGTQEVYRQVIEVLFISRSPDFLGL